MKWTDAYTIVFLWGQMGRRKDRQSIKHNLMDSRFVIHCAHAFGSCFSDDRCGGSYGCEWTGAEPTLSLAWSWLYSYVALNDVAFKLKMSLLYNTLL